MKSIYNIQQEEETPSISERNAFHFFPADIS